MEKNDDSFDLLGYLPKEIIVGEHENKYKLSLGADEKYISLSYITKHFNNSSTEHSLTIPRFISKNVRTFEVLGLLQAEMGKTQNGCTVFANSEPRLINYVILWFEKELEISRDTWKWYLAVNIQEPKEQFYKNTIEKKVKDYWISNALVNKDNSHPKTVTYRNTDKTKLKFYDYGTLMIEFKNNLFSQIIKKFLKEFTYENLLYEKKINVSSFMKGLIAGEGCVEINKKFKKYVVHITACKTEEREIYYNALKIIGIDNKIYEDYKDMIISKRKNLVQLLKQRLMTLHPAKYAKFFYMMQQYPQIREETGYFLGEKEPWNKTPKEVEAKILEFYHSGITNTKEISEKLNLGRLKVQRVLKANNLGKRTIKTEESLRKEIAEFTKNHPKMKMEEIAKHFKVQKQVVFRSYNKHYGKRGMQASRKISEEIEKRIIQIYKETPEVKFSEIMQELGISSTLIKRLRKEHNLMHLRYKHLIGNNNPKAKNNLHL